MKILYPWRRLNGKYMKKKALKKDFYIEIKKSLNRFLSIFFIVALGVAFFSGIQATAPDMRLTGDWYFDDSNLMDLRVISTLGLTEDDLEALLEVEGVGAVNGCYMEDVYCGEDDSQEVLHVESAPADMNRLAATAGEVPQKAGECFLDASYAQEMGYEPGDRIEITVEDEENSSLKRRSFTVSGYGYSPCYISFNKGSTTLGTGSVSGLMYVLPEDFDAEVFSVAYLTIEGALAETAFTDGYDALADEVLARVEAIEDVRCEIRYDEVISEAQEKIDDAKQEVEDGKQELADAREELADGKVEAESELTEAESELVDGQEQLRDGKYELLDAQRDVADGEQEMADGEQEIADNEQALADGRAQLEAGRSTLAAGEQEYSTGLSEYNEQAAAAKKELEAAQKQIDAGKKELEQGRQEYNTNLQAVTAGEAQLAAAEQTLNASQAALDAGAAELAAGQTQYAAGLAQYNAGLAEYEAGDAQYQAGLTQYNTGYAQYAAGLEAYQTAEAAYQTELGNYQTVVGPFETEWNTAKERLAQWETTVQEKQTALNTENGKLKEAQSTLEGYKKAWDDAAETLEKLKQQNPPADDETIKAAEKAVSDAQNNYTAQASTVNGLISTVATLTSELEVAKTNRDTALANENSAEEAYNTAVADNKTWKDTLDATWVGLEATKTTLDATGTELAATKATLDATGTELAASKATLDATAATLAATEATLNQKAAELEAAKTELAAGWQEYNTKKAELAAARTALSEGKTQLDASQKELDAGQSEIDSGYQELKTAEAKLSSARSELDLGWAQLNSSASQIANGEQQLAEGRQKLSDARQEIADAKQQILDAKKELAENNEKIKDGWKDYEDGKSKAEEEIADGEQKIADAEQELLDAEEEIADAEQELADIKFPEWYVNDRSVLPEYVGYGENAERIGNLAQVIPLLFFLVAALISLTTMTRMVEEQRTQIGTLKALGYSRWSIASKYLKYAFWATVGGSAFGILVGEKLLPWVIINAYGIMYLYQPVIMIPYNWDYACLSAGAALICTIGATFASCWKELQSVPAQLMRPPAPKEGKRILLERLPFLWKRLSFSWKSTVRNLLRYKKRFLMTIFGIGGCMGLLMVGYGLQDSIMDIGILQFEELQLYDAMVILDTDASAEKQAEPQQLIEEDGRVSAAMQFYMHQEDIRTDGLSNKEWSIYVYVPQQMEGLEDFLCFRDRETKEEYELTDEGAIITEKVASELGLGAGDTLYLKQEEGEDVAVPIAAVCENYLSHYLYMTPALYEKVYGEPAETNCIFFRSEEEESVIEKIGESLLAKDAVLNITYTGTLEEQIDSMLGAMDIVMIVLIVSAGMLAFVVLYNLNNININERRRELATLKVLGFYNGEVGAYVYRENILLTIIGAALGVALGKLLHSYVIATVEVDTCMFGRNINFDSFVYGTLFTFGFSVIVNFAMYFKLKKIDMVESLKSIE